MNKAKVGKKAYLTGRVKEQVILSKEGKALIPAEVSETVPETILRILIKKHILKVIHNKILQQQRTYNYLIIMVKIMNQENL